MVIRLSIKTLFLVSINLFIVHFAFAQNIFSTGRFTVGYGYYVYRDETLMTFPVHEHKNTFEFTTNILKDLYVGLTYTNVNFISNSIRKNHFQFGVLGMYRIELSKRIYLNSSILLNRGDFYVTQTYPFNESRDKAYYVGSRNAIEITPFNKMNYLKFELGLCLSYLINNFENKDVFNYPYIGCTIQLPNSK